MSFKAGFILRRQVRFAAAALGLHVQEFKGFIESGFVLSGDGAAIIQMHDWLKKVVKE